MNENALAEIFTWSDFSIQNDGNNNWFLILIYDSEDRKAIAYEVMSKTSLKLEVTIDPISKIYTFSLTFKFNAEKLVAYSFNTNLTSEGYGGLVYLNNGSVKFITTGTAALDNPLNLMYLRPLLPLFCQTIPN